MNKRARGSEYEEQAVAYLKKKGYGILERNFRSRQGEIDIIAKDQSTLVFVEVKYRKDNAKGDPAEAVNFHKQQKIIQVARYYCLMYHVPEDTSMRFDVIAILNQKITHYENAFQA